MTPDIDQIALDTAQHIEDALLRPYHSTAQRRAALQVIIANALRTSQLAAPYTLAEPVTDGWIAWNGGDCPVPSDTIVDIAIVIGKDQTIVRNILAGPCRWAHGGIGNIAAYRIVKEAPAPDADGWIDWDGGAVPVPDGTLVDVRMRNGKERAGQQAFRDREVSYAEPSRATPAYWIHDNIGNDIIAYRLHKEPTK